jgi:hypothetical protein
MVKYLEHPIILTEELLTRVAIKSGHAFNPKKVQTLDTGDGRIVEVAVCSECKAQYIGDAYSLLPHRSFFSDPSQDFCSTVRGQLTKLILGRKVSPWDIKKQLDDLDVIGMYEASGQAYPASLLEEYKASKPQCDKGVHKGTFVSLDSKGKGTLLCSDCGLEFELKFKKK